MPADFKQSTNLVGKVLAIGQVASANTDTVIYTVPGSTATKVLTFSLCNVSASPVTITKVGIWPTGATSDGTHHQIAGYSLAAGDTISAQDVLAWAAGLVLDAGARIVLNVSASAAVNYLATGAESS